MSTHNGIPHTNFPLNIQNLFFKRYKSAVPQISLRSVADIRDRGVYAIFEDDQKNTAQHNELVEANLTVVRLVEIWNNGYQVNVLRLIDCAEIFETISTHLQTWVGYLNSGIQVPGAPFEELLLLDRFADKIYIHARHERSTRGLDYFTEQIQGFNLGFNLNPMLQGGQKRLFNPLSGSPDTGEIYVDDSKPHLKERDGYAEELIRLGGKFSQDLRSAERQNIFDHI